MAKIGIEWLGLEGGCFGRGGFRAYGEAVEAAGAVYAPALLRLRGAGGMGELCEGRLGARFLGCGFPSALFRGGALHTAGRCPKGWRREVPAPIRRPQPASALDRWPVLRHASGVGFSPQQFEQLQRRLSGRRATRATTAEVEPPAATHQVLLGVDPSLRGTGYGIIRLAKPHPATFAHGTIHCPAGWDRSRCLVKIAQTLREVIREHRPTVCAIEGLFFAQNLKTALIMGEARGAALAAIAAEGLEIFEIAPRKVKLALVGYGGAQKFAVAKMVQRMLALPELPAPDAADALALALAHAQEQGRASLGTLKRV